MADALLKSRFLAGVTTGLFVWFKIVIITISARVLLMKMDFPGFSKVAFIDPKKKFGEEGQYVACYPKNKKMTRLIASARKKGMEIRYDYSLLGDRTPYRFIITEIPPGHVQPFHSHKNLCEMTIVLSGEIFYIESKVLTESSSRSLLKKEGKKLVTEGRVVDTSWKRHTVANFSKKYAKMITIQSDNTERVSFVADWVR